MKIADSGSTLAVVAGDSIFLPPFKELLIYFRYFLILLNFSRSLVTHMKIYNVNLQVFYSGPSRPQIISIDFNDKKLC